MVLYQTLLQSGKLTATQMTEVWSRYKTERVKQINELAKAEEDAGNQVMAAAIRAAGLGEIKDSYKQLITDISNMKIEGRVSFFEDLLKDASLTKTQVTDIFNDIQSNMDLLRPDLEQEMKDAGL